MTTETNSLTEIAIEMPWNGDPQTGRGVYPATIQTHIAAHDNRLRDALLLAAYMDQDDPQPKRLTINVLGDDYDYKLVRFEAGSDDETSDTLVYDRVD